MNYNGIDMAEYMRLVDIRGRGVTDQELTTVQPMGIEAPHVVDRTKPPRYLEVDFEIRAGNRSDLREAIDNVSAIIETAGKVPLIFSDESDRTYYVEYAGVLPNTERAHLGVHRGTFYFLRDPYKYGQEKQFEFTSDHVVVENKGSAEAGPVFEMLVKEPVTFAMVQKGEEYQMIGQPADDEVEVVDTRTSVLYENGSTIDQWQHTQSPDMINFDSNIDSLDGTMGTDDAGIRASSYGTAKQKQRGPAVYKDLITPVQDFELETTFDIISTREIENFRMMLYLNDENMNPIAQLGLKDNTKNYKRRRPIVQLGQHNQGERILGDSSKTIDNARDTTLFYLRMRREGERFSFYIGYWRSQKHAEVWEEAYTDVDGDYMGKLRYITLFIGSYQDRATPSRLRINSVEIFELGSITEDQTPYIARAGDMITLDHVNDDILLNGENRVDLKDFGGQFFKLARGDNELIIRPENAFEVTMTMRERWL